MSLAPIPWNPDRRTLREFSEAWMFVFGMIAAPLSLWRGDVRWAATLWSIAVLGRIMGLVSPSVLRPVFVGMILVGWPIGWVVSNLVLAVVFFLTVTPIGWALRLRRRDPLRRQFDPSAPSYWEPIAGEPSPRDSLRPF